MTDTVQPLAHLTLTVPVSENGQISRTQFRKALDTLLYYVDGELSARDLRHVMLASVNLREARWYGDEEIGHD